MPLYHPIRSDKFEIRLLTISAAAAGSNGEADFIHCTTEILSLQDTCKKYQIWASSQNHATKFLRSLQKAWYESQILQSDSLEPEPNIPFLPTPSSYRFNWGDYACLSYTWGDPKDLETVVFNGQEIQIQRNLENILRELRRRGYFEQGGFKLWADAICINQSDSQERSQQVQMMKHIYRRAWSVLSWLGTEEQESSKAIDIIRKLSGFWGDQKREEKLNEALLIDANYLGSGDGAWMALQTILHRPYWCRLWIIQEIALGHPGCLLICGESSISWDHTRKGLEVFRQIPNSGNLIRMDRIKYQAAYSLNQAVPGVAFKNLNIAIRILNVMNEIHRSRSINMTMTYEGLLDICESAVCQDDRDRVYGMLALLPLEVSSRISPDYKFSVSKVFMDLACAYIEADGNLDAIHRAGFPALHGGPSWVPDLTRTFFVRNPLRHPYQANKGHPILLSWEWAKFPFIIIGDNITSAGIIFDSIDGTGTTVSEPGNRKPRDLYQSETGRYAYTSIAKTQDAFRRLLIGNRNAYGNLPSEDELQIAKLPATIQFRGHTDLQRWKNTWDNFNTKQKDFVLGTRTLAEHLKTEHDDGNVSQSIAAAERWHLSFNRAKSGHRLMTTSRGYFAWMKMKNSVQPGDLICILFKCSMPLIIRPKGDNYELIGSCYVQGIMEGEAMEGVKSGEFPVIDITLC